MYIEASFVTIFTIYAWLWPDSVVCWFGGSQTMFTLANVGCLCLNYRKENGCNSCRRLCTKEESIWDLLYLMDLECLNFSCRQPLRKASSCYLDMDLLQILQEPQLLNKTDFQCNSERIHHLGKINKWMFNIIINYN